jgi:dynein heavy chain
MYIDCCDILLQNKVALSLPCIEVLSEAAAFSGRRPAVIHVLETTVVNWIKQIKV